MWEGFKKKIQDTIDKNVPWREINGRGRPTQMSKEVTVAIRKKKRLFKKVKGNSITQEYVEAEKKAKKLIRNGNEIRKETG